MIRARLESNIDISALDDFYERQVLVVDEVTRQLTSEFANPILSELQTIPRKRNYPSDYPIEWTSDKQRKAYFASNGFGRGIPYKRTGNLAKSWVVLFTNENGKFAVVITNPVPSAKFVYGSLARNVQQAKRFQQRFHAITGWELASPIVNYWVDEVQKDFIKKYRQAVGELAQKIGVKKRAYTR